MKVVLASRNRHKVIEIGALCADLPIQIVGIDDLAPDAPLREDEDTFEANALAKARQAVAATGLPALADDSGLEVDALGGRPGVWSARYAGEPCDDGANNDKLIRELAAIGAMAPERRTARYRCVAAYVDPARGIELTTSGACEGVIAVEPRGSLGFGYDPYFVVPSLGKTMAEIPLDQKNRLSHRAAAFVALAQRLRGELAGR
ncbi:MAG TPA: RdgB/HAM1 family non-canonical purine NTP pyrophosphatase [Polyangia bacterium]